MVDLEIFWINVKNQKYSFQSVLKHFRKMYQSNKTVSGWDSGIISASIEPSKPKQKEIIDTNARKTFSLLLFLTQETKKCIYSVHWPSAHYCNLNCFEYFIISIVSIIIPLARLKSLLM